MNIDFDYMYDRWEYGLTEEQKKAETPETVRDFFESWRKMSQGTGMDEESMTDEQIDNIVAYIMEKKGG